MLSRFSTIQKVALLVSLPVTATLLYFLFNRDEEEEEETPLRTATSRQTVIDLSVPKPAVGAVIGSKGAVIKQVQELSGARVNFKDEPSNDSDDRTVTIRGTYESAQQAEMMIRKIIAEQPVIDTETVYVPEKSLGRLIGKGGESIRGMSRTSKCKIMVDRAEEKRTDGMKPVEIRGTAASIAIARSLIEEKVEEEKAFRAKVALAATNRPTRGKPRDKQEAPEALPAAPPPEKPPVDWPLIGDFFPVYVSAVEHPEHFWVQLINTNSTRLDTMQQDMGTYYANTMNKEASQLDKTTVGDIVAAPYQNDGLWYRARIEGIMDDGRILDLYYVDYGDNGEIPVEQCMKLRTDFLNLPFQAYECMLDKVKPPGDNEDWPEESIVRFEELVYVAKWRALQVRTSNYHSDEHGSMPCLTIIDTNSDKDVNIGETLIAEGLASPAITETTLEHAAAQRTTSCEVSPYTSPRARKHTRSIDPSSPLHSLNISSLPPQTVKFIIEEIDDPHPHRKRVIYANLEQAQENIIRRRIRNENTDAEKTDSKPIRDSGIDFTESRLEDDKKLRDSGLDLQEDTSERLNESLSEKKTDRTRDSGVDFVDYTIEEDSIIDSGVSDAKVEKRDHVQANSSITDSGFVEANEKHNSIEAKSQEKSELGDSSFIEAECNRGCKVNRVFAIDGEEAGNNIIEATPGIVAKGMKDSGIDDMQETLTELSSTLKQEDRKKESSIIPVEISSLQKHVEKETSVGIAAKPVSPRHRKKESLRNTDVSASPQRIKETTLSASSALPTTPREACLVSPCRKRRFDEMKAELTESSSGESLEDLSTSKILVKDLLGEIHNREGSHSGHYDGSRKRKMRDELKDDSSSDEEYLPLAQSSPRMSASCDPMERIHKLTNRLSEVEDALDGISNNLNDLYGDGTSERKTKLVTQENTTVLRPSKLDVSKSPVRNKTKAISDFLSSPKANKCDVPRKWFSGRKGSASDRVQELRRTFMSTKPEHRVIIEARHDVETCKEYEIELSDSLEQRDTQDENNSKDVTVDSLERNSLEKRSQESSGSITIDSLEGDYLDKRSQESSGSITVDSLEKEESLKDTESQDSHQDKSADSLEDHKVVVMDSIHLEKPITLPNPCKTSSEIVLAFHCPTEETLNQRQSITPGINLTKSNEYSNVGQSVNMASDSIDKEVSDYSEKVTTDKQDSGLDLLSPCSITNSVFSEESPVIFPSPLSECDSGIFGGKQSSRHEEEELNDSLDEVDSLHSFHEEDHSCQSDKQQSVEDVMESKGCEDVMKLHSHVENKIFNKVLQEDELSLADSLEDDLDDELTDVKNLLNCAYSQTPNKPQNSLSPRSATGFALNKRGEHLQAPDADLFLIEDDNQLETDRNVKLSGRSKYDKAIDESLIEDKTRMSLTEALGKSLYSIEEIQSDSLKEWSKRTLDPEKKSTLETFFVAKQESNKEDDRKNTESNRESNSSNKGDTSTSIDSKPTNSSEKSSESSHTDTRELAVSSDKSDNSANAESNQINGSSNKSEDTVVESNVKPDSHVSWPFGTVTLDDESHWELASSRPSHISMPSAATPLYDVFYGSTDTCSDEDISIDSITKDIADLAPNKLKAFMYDSKEVIVQSDQVLKSQPEVKVRLPPENQEKKFDDSLEEDSSDESIVDQLTNQPRGLQYADLQSSPNLSQDSLADSLDSSASPATHSALPAPMADEEDVLSSYSDDSIEDVQQEGTEEKLMGVTGMDARQASNVGDQINAEDQLLDDNDVKERQLVNEENISTDKQLVRKESDGNTQVIKNDSKNNDTPTKGRDESIQLVEKDSLEEVSVDDFLSSGEETTELEKHNSSTKIDEDGESTYSRPDKSSTKNEESSSYLLTISAEKQHIKTPYSERPNKQDKIKPGMLAQTEDTDDLTDSEEDEVLEVSEEEKDEDENGVMEVTEKTKERGLDNKEDTNNKVNVMQDKDEINLKDSDHTKNEANHDKTDDASVKLYIPTSTKPRKSSLRRKSSDRAKMRVRFREGAQVKHYATSGSEEEEEEVEELDLSSVQGEFRYIDSGESDDDSSDDDGDVYELMEPERVELEEEATSL